MDGVEQGCKDYREALETTYPKLMQLAHSVFLHRFLVEKISDKSTELEAGLVSVTGGGAHSLAHTRSITESSNV